MEKSTKVQLPSEITKNVGWNQKKQKVGFYFILPWLIGFVLFAAIPMVAAIVISLTDWSILGDANFVGLANFKELFQDPAFVNSIKVSMKYSLVAIPLGIVTSFTIAFVLTLGLKGEKQYRVIYYLPAIVSGVAIAIVWRWILDPNFGLINQVLKLINIKGPDWLGDPSWVMPSYWLMGVWGAGAGILTYIVGIKDIPKSLYESARISGVSKLRQTWKITIPLMSPILFYNLIMGIIGAFRKFSDAWIIGGAGQQGEFVMVYIYKNAFTFYRMGYATAAAWVLFAIIMAFTGISFLTKKYWVYSA